jgi:hypothetical protein
MSVFEFREPDSSGKDETELLLLFPGLHQRKKKPVQKEVSVKM